MQIIAKDDYEKNFISSVVPANETGVRFDDIGALEDVKMTLNELVTLPMIRPELFSRGNLLRVLFFYPISDSFLQFSTNLFLSRYYYLIIVLGFYRNIVKVLPYDSS